MTQNPSRRAKSTGTGASASMTGRVSNWEARTQPAPGSSPHTPRNRSQEALTASARAAGIKKPSVTNQQVPRKPIYSDLGLGPERRKHRGQCLKSA